MQAVSFNERGEPIDPKTGLKLDMPIGVAAALSGIRPKPPEQETKDVVNPPPAAPAVPTPVQEGAVVVQAPTVSSRTPTRYEVGKDSTFVLHFGIVAKEDRLVVIKVDDAVMTKGAEPHWVKFRMWQYPEELKWKNEATDFDASKRVHTLNNDRLNELKLRNLLLDWSFGVQEPDLRLMHVNGLLSDESLKVFFALYPTVIRHIIDRMNEVLEYNA